jgi:hypothetical protein
VLLINCHHKLLANFITQLSYFLRQTLHRHSRWQN